MNFFKSILSFFNRDNVKAFLNLGLQILKMVAGSVATDIQRITQEEVNKAEVAGKTGTEKYETAYKAIKKRLPEVAERTINLALELAVNALTQAKG